MASELEDLKKLRDITGAGILDCKKYLVRASNNLDEAIKLMRSEEGIKADKKSSRVAAEGVVFYYSTDEVALLLEINSETDFVAKSDDFINYVKQTANMISGSTFVDYDQLMSSDNETLKNDTSITNLSRRKRKERGRGRRKDTIHQCVDFDEPIKIMMDVKSLRYCFANDGYTSNNMVDIPVFKKLVQTAVEYQQFKLDIAT